MASEAIAAIATPPGRGGIGVIRISGTNLLSYLRALGGSETRPRHAARATFRDAKGRPIDDGLILFFPGPHSYTGEDVIELQGHGGPAVLQMLLERCLELGARIAEAGEFTRRAFLNGRMDLAQAEAVVDLINASTDAAVRSAARSLDGEFSILINNLVENLINLRTLVEALIDFPEEGIDLSGNNKVSEKLSTLRSLTQEILSAAFQGSLLREGVQIVLAGAPNVGKSSLLNKLSGAERAIVTEFPGTTRDVIREHINIEGVPFHVLDTAGLRDTLDPVEAMGIAKTKEAVSRADIVLWISDLTRAETAGRLPEVAGLITGTATQIDVGNKLDLVARDTLSGTVTDTIRVSARSGEGLDKLKAAILHAAGWKGEGEGLFMARSRHLENLRSAAGHLDTALAQISQLELVAEELRRAQLCLSGITGEFGSDDLLGQIFSKFCIGK